MAAAAAGLLRPPPAISSSSSLACFALASSSSSAASWRLATPRALLHLARTPWPIGLGTQHKKQLGFASCSSYYSSLHFLRRRREKKGRRRGNIVYASLFGVGAPEALVIGVVALLVFGPKGLAEVARNLGKTFRAFQPTIRELQDVSREFRSTLEREIGLDEVPPSTSYRPTGSTNNNQQPAAEPNGKPANVPYSGDELLKVTEEQIAASAAAAWKKESSPSSEPLAASTTSELKDRTSSGVNAAPAAASDNSSQTQSSENAEGER